MEVNNFTCLISAVNTSIDLVHQSIIFENKMKLIYNDL